MNEPGSTQPSRGARSDPYADRNAGYWGRRQRCPRCGFVLGCDAAFCTACGRKLPAFYSRLRIVLVAVLGFAVVAAGLTAYDLRNGSRAIQWLRSWYSQHFTDDANEDAQG